MKTRKRRRAQTQHDVRFDYYTVSCVRGTSSIQKSKVNFMSPLSKSSFFFFFLSQKLFSPHITSPRWIPVC